MFLFTFLVVGAENRLAIAFNESHAMALMGAYFDGSDVESFEIMGKAAISCEEYSQLNTSEIIGA